MKECSSRLSNNHEELGAGGQSERRGLADRRTWGLSSCFDYLDEFSSLELSGVLNVGADGKRRERDEHSPLNTFMHKK